ncbi:MAG: hypothetical protein ACHP9Z_05680 [Streptosporangiales bacterium]
MPARSPSRPARALLRLVVAPGLTVLLAACGSGLTGTPVTPSPGTSGPAAAPTSPGGTGTGSPGPGTPAPGTPASGATSPPGTAHCGMRPMPGTGGTAQPVTGVLTLGNQNNGGTFCVRPGERVMVYLRGTPGQRWAAIRSDSAALVAVASGLLSLPVGVTGAAFLAARPGTAHLTSDRPVCSSGPVRCDALLAFRVTVIVAASAAAN